MNFLKRAWRYVTRKKTKSILLALTFFVIGNLVILGLGISAAAENAKVLTRKSMRAVVSYEVDYDSYYAWIDTLTDEDEINAAYENYPSIDTDTAARLAEDERVKAYNYYASYIATLSSDYTAVPIGNEDTSVNSGDMGNLNLIGFDGATMIEMAEGTYTIASGRFVSKEDQEAGSFVCNITSQLADQNNLHVGDTISFSMMDTYMVSEMQNSGWSGFDEASLYQEYEIVGIYDNAEEVDPNSDNFQWMSQYENPQNIILLPLSAYQEQVRSVYLTLARYYAETGSPYGISEEEAETYAADASTPSQVIYLLDDPLNVDQFCSDYESLLTDTYTRLNANNETFRKMARPLDTLSFFADIIVAIVVVNAVIIISLVTALTLKTREYEIGVLLSIGVSKVKIVAQLFCELIFVAILGLAAASVTGSLMAGQVGDKVLEFQTATEAQYQDTTTDDNYYYYGDQNYFTEVTQEQLLSQYHVSISPALLAEIYLLGAGVVLIACIVPSFMIMRLNPKQILLEQN